MTIDLTDVVEELLGRMLDDRWRVEAGERLVGHLIDTGAVGPPFAALVLDLDGSGPVRARGIDAKIELVRQLQRLVHRLLPDDAVVIDSGSRDEIYAVLPGSDAETSAALAERIRAAVAAEPFTIDGPDDVVRLTTSVGRVAVTRPTTAADLFGRLREALFTAKRVRDAVRTDESDPQRLTVAIDPAVLDHVHRHGATLPAALRTGLWLLAEKLGPVWYWIADRAGADRGTVPTIPYDLAGCAAPPPAVEFFEYLVWSVALEAALGARLATGYRARVTATPVRPDAPPDALLVRYFPDEWLVVEEAADAPVTPPADVFALIDAARSPASVRASTGNRPTTVALHPHELATLDRIARTRGRTRDALVGEALRLAADHLSTWHGRTPTPASLDVFPRIR